MDQVQQIWKAHWEKIVLGVAALFLVWSVVWPIVFPSQAAQKSQEVVVKLKKTVDKILASAPPKEELLPYGDIIQEPYTKDLPKAKEVKWVFHRKPYIWRLKYTGPKKVRKSPIFERPEQFTLRLDKEGIRLKWRQSENNAYCYLTKIEVYRKVGDGEFQKIATLSGDAREYVDQNVAPQMEYTYYIKCYARAEEGDDVTPFPEGEKVVESQQVAIATLPETIVDILSFQLGETVYYFLPKGATESAEWKEPPEGYQCPKGKEVKRLVWMQSYQGRKPLVRFTIWLLDPAKGSFVEYRQAFNDTLGEGDHIFLKLEKWNRGQKVVQWVDSGYMLLRLGLGHIDKKIGKTWSEMEIPVVFLAPKSVNEGLCDVVLSAFGLEGTDKDIVITIAKGDGAKQKQRAEDQMKGTASSEEEEESSREERASGRGGGKKKPEKKDGGSSPF